MLCWLCQEMKPDRGGLCHVCRRALQPNPDTPPRDSRLIVAVAVTGLMMVAVGLLGPAAISPLSAPRRNVAHAAPPRPSVDTPIGYRTVMVVEQVKRKVYPYSIVAGGAENLREAKIAMSDPAVQAHYAAFNLNQLRQEKLPSDLKGYVSYRWGNQIYWTAKTITLHAGETVFTDGTHIARGRCLNCYSALPMQPIRPHEPSEKTLDVAIEMPMTVYSFPQLPLYAPALPISPGELTPSVPVLPAVGPAGGKPGGGIWFPLIPIIPPIHHHPTSPPSGPIPPSGPVPPSGPIPPPSGPTPPPPPPPVAVVPEPTYGVLLGAGLAAIVLAYHLRRRSV